MATTSECVLGMASGGRPFDPEETGVRRRMGSIRRRLPRFRLGEQLLIEGVLVQVLDVQYTIYPEYSEPHGYAELVVMAIDGSLLSASQRVVKDRSVGWRKHAVHWDHGFPSWLIQGADPATYGAEVVEEVLRLQKQVLSQYWAAPMRPLPPPR
jgi:hypothetical protein